MKALFNFFYRRFYPIKYARHIGVKVGNNCRLIDCKFSTEPYLVTLGNHVSATGTRFETHDGGIWVFRDELPEIDIVKPITVGNNVFLGYGSVVLPGVTIGDNVVIGAYAVVSRDIPSNSVAAGVPAKVIKDVNSYKEKSKINADNTKRLNPEQKRAYFENKYAQNK